jgi:hypothetical protein
MYGLAFLASTGDPYRDWYEIVTLWLGMCEDFEPGHELRRFTVRQSLDDNAEFLSKNEIGEFLLVVWLPHSSNHMYHGRETCPLFLEVSTPMRFF